VLLRIAIGWHFLYEGWEKVESTQKAGKGFTAEPYLRFSTGPLAPTFRGLIPDVNSIHKLNPIDRKASWKADVDRIAEHYHFDQAQRDKAQIVLKDSEDYADIWFEDRETKENRQKYFAELGKVQKIEQNPNALSYERERAAAKRKDLDVDRRKLIADLDARGETLREAVTLLATPEQREAAGPYVPPRTTIDWVNLSTMWGLVIMGVCLILGLFTPLAALAGAVFLGQIYLSMPPWPGLPPNPMAEGHYFIVNKNLIEMLACLALACLPTGSWIGLDALLFGARRRRRELARELAEAESARAPGRTR
jgi:uncharacterized membrane protein YphA (DoxX/SURF4 family)